MQYKIYEENLERLEKKLTRIENKCKKYGAGFHYEVVGEEFREVGTSEGNVILRFVIVDVEGFAKINGWEFVATVDHHPEGNVIRNIIDIDIPDKYWHSEPYCEHCKTHRRRNDTFLVHNVETGEFKQVGRSCLCDFTGGYDAELAASYISMYEELIEGESSSGYSGGFVHYQEVDKVLRMAKAVITKMGFVSSSSETAHPTKYVVFDLDHILAHGVTKTTQYVDDAGVVDYYKNTDNDAYIEEVKKYFLEREENSSYVMNLKVLFSSPYCKYRDFGYIVSAVASYDREMEKRRQKAAAEARRVKESEVSQYQGQVGKKITFQVREFKCVSCYEDGYGGYSYLWKFIDTDGNVFMWSTGKSFEEDDVIETITGTVKKFEEYRGLKQTWVTRCKVTFGKKEEPKHEVPEVDPVEEAFKLLDTLEEEAC